jgi:hypothetical protein
MILFYEALGRFFVAVPFPPPCTTWAANQFDEMTQTNTWKTLAMKQSVRIVVIFRIVSSEEPVFLYKK